MDLRELEQKLSEARNDLATEIQSYLATIPHRQDPSISEYDLDELARQVFYAFCGFQDNIIAYLKAHERKHR